MERNKSISHYLLILILFSLFLLNMTTGYPIDKVTSKADLKDETRYPNGTVIGKYTYTDNDGNPVHVKYYADEGSYGVELKSLKVLDSSTIDSSTMAVFPKTTFDILKPIESPFSSELGNTEFGKAYYKNKYNINNDKNKVRKNKKFAKSRVEYEIFYQNDLQGPAHCGTDKVKVYLDKQNRIARNALEDDQASKYCGQF